MTRDDLIRSLVDKQRHISYKDMSVAAKHLIETMAGGLAEYGRIEIRGFGSFALRSREPRIARNPKTGAPVMMEGKQAIHFKPGKELKERVNSAYQTAD